MMSKKVSVKGGAEGEKKKDSKKGSSSPSRVVMSLNHVLILSVALNVGFFINHLGLKDFINTSVSNSVCGEKPSKQTPFSSSLVTENGGGGGIGDEQKLLPSDSVINLDHGDPTMYESFWRKMGDKATIVIPGWQCLSYFSDIKQVCWFLEPDFAQEIIRLHKLVGNANTKDRYIVVGTGSTQLFQAALYALSPSNATEPISVVSAAPYYSSYPLVTDFLKSGLYRWAGDAYTFNKEGPYIELVTSPNNPDGYSRESVVKHGGGTLVHDLAYYWPQYAPLTSMADHEIMLFTVSKSTGHAGTRLGWALVKDKEVAKKMTKYIELNTIGVSKDSQLRAAKILRTLTDSCENMEKTDHTECFFKDGHLIMAERWGQLRDAVQRSGMFSLPQFSPDFCNYKGTVTEPHPAFAWLRCEGEVQDCESFLKGHKILTRSGRHFGEDPKYVRVSMLDRNESFKLFVERLSSIHS
ncbi:Tryptophan aminotransferase-related protein [Thalictrum thalictroides]|uniref:Tryptophan aminotransferase-related protein n=1 Tax=Thalictrum thalictroides TaxID=46969 RepID=A0A7J6VK36_THATH|nr:Tryptophan aminotransferase-related protein [Thalictrum thalictroides]